MLLPHLSCWCAWGAWVAHAGQSSVAALDTEPHSSGARKVAVMTHSMITEGRSDRSPAHTSALVRRFFVKVYTGK